MNDCKLNVTYWNKNSTESICVQDINYDKKYFALYRNMVEYIFRKAPKYPTHNNSFDEDDIAYYKYGLYEYLKNLYPLFFEIVTTGISSEFFTALARLDNIDEQQIYYEKLAKFVDAIKLNPLRQGSCVDRYVKDLPYISPFICRLLKKHKGHCILANSDTDSLDYKLALFSCFPYFFFSEKRKPIR